MSLLKMGERSMRSLIAISASVAMLVAQAPVVPARAETAPPASQVVSENSAIAQTFKAFPTGGDALSKRFKDLIIANPKVAPDLVIYMRNSPQLNRAQKVAAEHGLAAALDALRMKAADLGVPVYKAPPAPVVEEDWWLVALGILGVAAAICIAACQQHQEVVVVQASPH